MKKQLIGALLAASLAVPAYAAVKINGDARFRYHQKSFSSVTDADNNNISDHRVRVGIESTFGNSKAYIRLDAKDDEFSASKKYIQTDIGGGFTVKLGEWGEEYGLGLINNAEENEQNRIQVKGSFSGIDIMVGTYRKPNKTDIRNTTVVRPLEVGTVTPTVSDFVANPSITHVRVTLPEEYITEDNSNKNFFELGVSGNFSGIKLAYIYADSAHQKAKNAKIHNLSVKGDFQGINFGAEYHKSKLSSANAYAMEVGTSFQGVDLKFAYAKYQSKAQGDGGYDPLYTDSTVRIVDFNTNYDTEKNTSLVALTSKFRYSGLDFAVSLGNFDANQKNLESSSDKIFKGKSNTFKALTVGYPLGKGTTLKTSYGDWAGQSIWGARVDVSF